MKTPRAQPSFRKVGGLAAAVAIAVSSVAAVFAETVKWPALARYEAMVVPADNPMTRDKVSLGKQLFFDRRLSGDGTTACASCHRPDHGFADGLLRAPGAYGMRSGRACPTLWNVGYQQSFFWEGSGPTLEAAVGGMWRFNLAPGKEGQASMADVAGRLAGVAGYRRQFQTVFGGPPTPENVPRAIAAFLRTLVANDSAWVRFQSGDAHALTARARDGWAIFDGKGRCTTCHAGVLLTDLQFHNVGIGSAGAKPAAGRFVMTQQERDRGAFKTPSLLDVSRSAPYFHDGSVPTLEAAVDLMAGGGIPNPSLDGALSPTSLTPAEREALLAFLRELVVDTTSKAPRLP
jgi:cytochrome c peroxidase